MNLYNIETVRCIYVMSDFPPNPGELPVFKLRDKIKPQFPVDPVFSQERKKAREEQGQEQVEEDPAEGPLSFGDGREKLVKYLQSMLRDLGFQIGTSKAPDGVDGIFGERTRKAVREFQEKNTDVDGNPLKIDGMVGPRTADALDRKMVGLWYEKYETPKEMKGGKTFITITSKRLTEGILFATDNEAQELKAEAEGVAERRRRTDGRAAFVNTPQALRAQPPFEIQVLDGNLNSVGSGVRFEEERSKERITNVEGIIKVTKSKTLLTLIGKD
jgi:peptidoglycan hydrolase-like protein with peptidoglycan-binding domain